MAIAWKKLAFDSEVVKHSLATAENDFLVAPASGSFVKKTLAETQEILNIFNSGDCITQRVHQEGHGFAVGDVLKVVSGVYYKAQADSAANAEVVGIVRSVSPPYLGENDFDMLMYGHDVWITGLTSGTVYFLSPDTAGALTDTEPTTPGHISKPLMIGSQGGGGFFVNMRGVEVADPGDTGCLPLAGGTMQGNIVMPDGGSIGQSDGPLLTFDDSNNALKLTGGSLGINTTTTSAPLVIEAHATSYTYGAYIGRTVTQPTSGLYGMSVNVRDVATSDHSGPSYGMIFGVYVGAADGSDSKNRTGAQYGVQGFTWHNGTGTCNAMYGGYFGCRNTVAGGTISSARCIQVTGGNAAGINATISNYQGIYIGNINDSGTITNDYGIYIACGNGTNRYGLRIADFTGGSTNYAIYTGAGAVRIGGEFGCNGATPRAAATLTGSAAATYDTTTRNLINAIATALKNNGICQ